MSLNYYETLLAEWKKTYELSLANSAWSKKIIEGTASINNYKGYLRETYHHAGINPQIQAFCTMYFRNNPRDMIDLFYKHAVSEIGHDILALNDLEALGIDPETVVNSRPLPSTIALNAFVIFQIQFSNPLGYLGYLFHLEFLPTLQGENYISKLKNMGIPEGALSFLDEHSKVDIGHNKLMKKYIENMVRNDKDFDDILYCMNCTCSLHSKMIDDAFINGEIIYR